MHFNEDIDDWCLKDKINRKIILKKNSVYD